jgi:lysozyme
LSGISADAKPVDAASFRKQISKHEGRKSRLYKDTKGIWTIGVGRNMTRPLSEAAIDFLLDEDIEDHHRELHQALPWVKTLDPTRQAVLLDMAFNLGVPGLLNFKRTLASIERGDYALASNQMLESLWASQVGQRAHTLAQMMRTGVNPFLS